MLIDHRRKVLACYSRDRNHSRDRNRSRDHAAAYSSDRKAATGRLHVWAGWRYVVQTLRGIVR
jgi:hypothetical protein